MQAATINQFGGIETLTTQILPTPRAGADQVLIRIESAGVAVWDIDEREGRYAKMVGTPKFPYILGWDGAGTVVAVGEQVTRFKGGDRVFASTTPKHSGGGFYSQYTTVEANHVWLVPDKLTLEQAGTMGWDVLTALTGLDDTLGLKPNETLLVFGASGGIGHMAIQLAKRMGARVLAVASGDDGVSLCLQLGADAVINGRKDDVMSAANKFAPHGLDTVLLTAGGDTAKQIISESHYGSRIAYPDGVDIDPRSHTNVHLRKYDASRSQETIAKLQYLINSGPFEVHVSRTFSLEQVADAHRTLKTHFLGKLALRPNGK